MLSETASTSAEGGGLHCGSIELIVEQGARLRYVNLQNWGHEVWHFAHQKAHVGREGRLQWTIGALGSRLAKVNQHVAMTGPDAEVQVNGVMFTEGRQHLVVQHASASSGAVLQERLAVQGGAAGPLAHRVARHDQGRPRRPADRCLSAQRQSHALARCAGRFDSGPGDRGRRRPLHARQHVAAASTSSRCFTR